MILVAEVEGEATPAAPTRSRPDWALILKPSYIISAFCRGLSVCIYNFLVSPWPWPRCVNARARGGRRGRRWPWSTSSPAGTTEAQVDDQILVVEVAGEATPTPTRSRPDWAKNSNPLI